MRNVIKLTTQTFKRSSFIRFFYTVIKINRLSPELEFLYSLCFRQYNHMTDIRSEGVSCLASAFQYYTT